MYYIPGPAERRGIGKIEISDIVQVHASPEGAGKYVYPADSAHFSHGLSPEKFPARPIGYQFDPHLLCPGHDIPNSAVPHYRACRMIARGDCFLLVDACRGNFEVEECKGLSADDAGK